ncbi:hypothetical protein CDV36_006620 [Fusarium kuroshium]|uniref:Uncharacterized protein n=1 Tax=Fusarium kuroshium TaxID=2010991 RepID=A0A3M2S7Z2_9HYPO|nr:hypothetical protein CDV36_006620 [Fusarium kuroshium]
MSFQNFVQQLLVIDEVGKSGAFILASPRSLFIGLERDLHSLVDDGFVVCSLGGSVVCGRRLCRGGFLISSQVLLQNLRPGVVVLTAAATSDPPTKVQTSYLCVTISARDVRSMQLIELFPKVVVIAIVRLAVDVARRAPFQAAKAKVPLGVCLGRLRGAPLRRGSYTFVRTLSFICLVCGRGLGFPFNRYILVYIFSLKLVGGGGGGSAGYGSGLSAEVLNLTE